MVMWRTIKKDEVIIFVTEAKGPGVQLWKFDDVKLSLLNTFNNSNAYESEGCVFDDENQKFFISEENKKELLDPIHLQINFY